MAQLNNARQWQRFAYPADVALATDAGAPEPHVIAALAVDLSLGGMQLLAANAPRVGAAISCKFPNDHSELQLRGFVRWSTPDKRPGTQFQSRVGVEFEPLSSLTRQVVQALISHAERAGELVRVQLPDWPFALQGVAVPSERGMRVHVPLPSIAQGSSIKFTSLSPQTQLEGRVLETDLTLCRMTQALELSMVLEPSEPARRRRYTVYDQPGAIVVHADGPAPAAVQPWSMRARGPLAVIGAAVLFGGLGWLLAATRPAFRMAPHHVAVVASAHESPAAAVDPITVAELRAPDDAVARDAEAMPLGSPAHAPPPMAANIPLVDAAAPIAPNTEVATPRDSAPDDAPSFAVNDELNEVFVPTRGSLASLRTAVWVDPAALVVDLPDAEVSLPHARYGTHTGCLLGLSAGKPRGQTQLRVYLSEKLARYTTSESAEGLTIRVRCTADNSEQSH